MLEQKIPPSGLFDCLHNSAARLRDAVNSANWRRRELRSIIGKIQKGYFTEKQTSKIDVLRISWDERLTQWWIQVEMLKIVAKSNTSEWKGEQLA